MVSEVCLIFFLFAPLATNIYARCQALRGNLDEDALDRSQAFTEALFEEGTLDLMWDEYGIVGDLVVSLHYSYHLTLLERLLAIYEQFPSRRHLPLNCAGHSTSAHKRLFQGPLSQLGHCIYSKKTPKERSGPNIG